MHFYIALLILSSCARSTAQAAPSAQIIEGNRQIETIQEAREISEAALAYISSCESSTPLSGGAGASPSLNILNFRDLVATNPISVIRLNPVQTVTDKSGIKGEPPLKLIEITIVHLDENKMRVYAHTDMDGYLIEFTRPSKDTEMQLGAIIKKHKK